MESARQDSDIHKAVATDKEEKHQKVVKAARALKIKHDAMKEEKEKEKRDLESTKGVCRVVTSTVLYLLYSQTAADRRGNEIIRRKVL